MSAWEGRAVRDWASRLGVPHFEAHLRIGSTNDRAKELARAGGLPFAIVLAEAQQAGRGRGGKRWESMEGKGLWLSVLIPVGGTASAGLVPLRTGLAVCRAIERLEPRLGLMLKWPNDILAGARKLGGVLCERPSPDFVTVGLGLNVSHSATDFPSELRGHATSLDAEVGRPVARARLFECLVGELRQSLDSPAETLDPSTLAEISARDGLRGKSIRVVPGPTGAARGIDVHGRLLVETVDGTLPVVAGSVQLTEPAGRVPPVEERV